MYRKIMHNTPENIFHKKNEKDIFFSEIFFKGIYHFKVSNALLKDLLMFFSDEIGFNG